MRYERIVKAISSTPWAITAPKLAQITDLVALRASGERLTDQEVQASLGAHAQDARGAQMVGSVAVAQFSPDGDWLAYRSNETGQNEVYVQPYPKTGQKHQISTDGGVSPMWSRDGRELFYKEAVGGDLMAVTIETEPTFSAGAPQMLFSTEGYMGSVSAANYDTHPDGERFLMLTGDSGSAPTQVILVENWFEEIKRLVPIP